MTTTTDNSTIAGLTADQAAYLRATVAPAGIRYEAGVTTLSGEAIVNLSLLPIDADGYFDGDAVWIGGTEYDVTLRPDSLTFLNVCFAIASNHAGMAVAPDGLWAVLAASLTAVPGVEWRPPNQGSLRVVVDGRDVLAIGIDHDGDDFLGFRVFPPDGVSALGSFTLTCSAQALPALLPGILHALLTLEVTP